MLSDLLKSQLGKKRFQAFFEKTEFFSRYGRNIGSGIDINSSGEIPFIITVHKLLQNNNLDGFNFVDIGANEGDYTFQVLKQFVSENGKFLLFEPQSELYQRLVIKYKDNKNVEVFNMAIGEKEGELELYKHESINTLASFYEREINETKLTIKESVKVVPLTDFLKKKGIDHIDFLKVDVEGHEYKVFEGAIDLIKNDRIKIIQFEFGKANLYSRTFFKDFWDLLHERYNFYRILKDGLWPIENYKIEHEYFHTTNYALFNKNLNFSNFEL